MVHQTKRIFNEVIVGDDLIMRYPTRDKNGLYQLTNSVGFDSNQPEHRIVVSSLDEVIRLMLTGKYKLRLATRNGDHQTLLVLPSISIPEYDHTQCPRPQRLRRRSR